MLKLTKSDFKRFAPNAKPQYVDALFANLDKARAAGLLDNKLRWAHFIGQCAAETDSFVILRESLDYRTVRAIRNAWGARSSKVSDEWIAANLLKNPVALGDWAYGGREGNRKGTTDGFDFRGGGWLQTTHANAVKEYCAKCDVPFTNDVLDDVSLTLQFALFEWTEGKCNGYADRDDVVSIAKIINTGSAKSNIRPNGMDRRRQEVAKALRVWSEPEDVEPEPIRPFPEAATVSALAMMPRSQTVWTLLLGALEYCFGVVQKLFDMIPEINTDVTSIMAPLANLSNTMKLNIAAISTAIVLLCIGRAIMRHSVDKAAKQTLEQG